MEKILIEEDTKNYNHIDVFWDGTEQTVSLIQTAQTLEHCTTPDCCEDFLSRDDEVYDISILSSNPLESTRNIIESSVQQHNDTDVYGVIKGTRCWDETQTCDQHNIYMSKDCNETKENVEDSQSLGQHGNKKH